MKYINTNDDPILEAEDNRHVTYKVIHTFRCVENGKNYVILTDGSTDENRQQNIYAASYNPNKDECELVDLETDEEYEMVNQVLHDLLMRYQ
ncbi:MAG: DUF1292 domain-containing protein [Acutalibacteraceae bacterium]